MAGFLYFIEGLVNPLTDSAIDRAALRYAFDRKPMSARIEGRTPSGGVGTLVADQKRLGEATFAYSADEQQWDKIPMAGDHQIWVGYWKQFSPGPDDLKRPRSIPGKEVKMGDGRRWTVPLLFLHSEPDKDPLGNEIPGSGGFAFNLPTYVGMDGSGKLVTREIVHEFRPQASLAEELFAMLKGGTTQDEAIRMSVRLLSINYAISIFEATELLRLFRDDVDFREVPWAAADWQTFLDRMEKKSMAEAVTTGSAT